MLIHMDGFDHYGDDETKLTEGVYSQADAAFSISSINPRTGSKCIRRDSTSVESSLVKIFDSGRDVIGTGFSFYMDSLPAFQRSYLLSRVNDSSGSDQIVLFVGTNGEINATLGDRETIIAMSDDGVISPNVYNHIEYALVIDNGTTLAQMVGNISELVFSGSIISAIETDSVVDVFVSSDDVFVYLLNDNPNTVFQYEMSTPGDISTASYTGKSFSVSAQVLNEGSHSITFRPDGKKMYVSNAAQASAPVKTYQYSLATAWDVSTASYDLKSFTSAQDNVMFAIQFNEDGTKMVGVGDVNDRLYSYNLSSAWDISTATYSGTSFDNSNELTDAHNIRFNQSGSAIYLLGFNGNTIFQYSLSSNYDISTCSYSGIFFSATETVETHGFCFNSDITSAYIADISEDTVYQYSFPIGSNDSDGILEVRVNGVTVISNSGTKTRSNNDDNYHDIALSCGSTLSHGVTTDIDDWYIWDDSGSWNNSFLGDRRCFLLKPNQDTNIADFEPNSGSFGYKMIDDESPDDDSTYIIAEAYLQSGSPLTGTSEFKIENLSNGSSLISGICVSSRASKTDNTSAEIYTSITSGSDSLVSDAHILTTSYQYYHDIYEYDPATISSITKDGMNSLSVSITADDLDPGVALESPDQDAGSPEDITPITGGTLGIAGTGITLTDGNKTATKNSGNGAWASTRSNASASSGKHYFEFLVNLRGATASTVEIGIGIIDSDNSLNTFFWASNYGYGYGAEQGRLITSATTAAFGDPYTTSDIVGVAIDLDANKIWFRKNGVWQNSGDPDNGLNEAATLQAGITFYPSVSIFSDVGSSVTSKFDTDELTYAAPTGFAAGIGA